ncbi:nucleoside deaminase [Mailhella massiliensis]|uniref:tRNA-specific adenosine deaminase n=1 Tax=Mailhella massiliensis TaxID=1903261 RepID=A0A921DRN8_9BACT|nr:nucleoside deaminase [Mailhella massiliensis]HJD97865.1 nucleoside deaminase [Mailhella massiliensis]
MELFNRCPEEERWRPLPSWGPEPPAPSGRSWRSLMGRALRLARQAERAGEVPVGALVVDGQGCILAEAHNETESSHDPTAHAEVLALRRAALAAGNHRLSGSVLVVTLEPCLMCTGALREARVSGVVFGASDARAGAVCSCLEGLDYAQTGSAPWSYGGVEAEKCARLLTEFFRKRR